MYEYPLRKPEYVHILHKIVSFFMHILAHVCKKWITWIGRILLILKNESFGSGDFASQVSQILTLLVISKDRHDNYNLL